MEIITCANAGVVKTWNTYNIIQDTYRINKYVILTECKEKILFYNMITGEMICLSHKEFPGSKVFCDDNNQPDSIVAELIKRHYLVPEGYNEKQAVDNIRYILKNIQQDNTIYDYVIFPTTACNARCFYCYESDLIPKNMTDDIASNAAKFICDHSGNREIHIKWFGGEPLLALHQIKIICNVLEANHRKYYSTITTNGLLFNKEIIKEAIQLWHLRYVMITLDGSEQIYNQVKNYKNYTGNAFRTVFSNIKDLLDAGLSVDIRLNMDFHNYLDLKNLIKIIYDEFSVYKKLRVYVHEIYENTGYKKISHTDEEIEKLYALRDELEDLIQKYSKTPVATLKSLKINHCMADINNSLGIGPEGELIKCEHHPCDLIVGSLENNSFNQEMIAYWREKKRQSLCDECQLYPLCTKIMHCDPDTPCNQSKINYKILRIKKTMCDIYTKRLDS